MVCLAGLVQAAAARNRLWLGSAEGEDLQVNNKPPWCRRPDLDMVERRIRAGVVPCGRGLLRALPWQVLAGGAMEDRARDAMAARKAAAVTEKLDFVSYADFQARPCGRRVAGECGCG